MARLTRRLLGCYQHLKREQGWVDMADVEDAAQSLLGDPVVGAWVQERLDQRVRHLLIDEFQDTNPSQWQALQAWLGSYSGAGGAMPGMFFVGDPKQSIYRFRRAEPAVFLAAQAFVRDGLAGELLSCDHTRRNAPEVLAAVNATLQQPQVAEAFTGFRPHTTASNATGSVVALPAVARPEPRPALPGDGPPPWRDSLEQPLEEPEDGLRTTEARQAAAYLAQRIAQGLPPAQVMVLSRRRANLGPMRDALRDLGIGAQIGEKTTLADCAEVQDLVALLDVLSSPGHDLSLARALKSPLFALADADLVELARRQREQPRGWLAWVLASWPDASPGLRRAGETLERWQGWVRSLPPHDALQAIYDDGDVLAGYAAAVPANLRAATLDNLRALLAAALALGGGRFATPYALVRAFRAPGGIKAPAALQPDAVRLLTIHGAKGLEAELVLLLDTDQAAPKAQSMAVLVDWPAERTHPRRFVFLASEARPPACAGDAMALEQAQRRREEHNALYVAMTRARCELVVSAITPRQPDARSWWNLLQPVLVPAPELPQPVAAPAAPGPATPEAPIELAALPAPVAIAAGLAAVEGMAGAETQDADASRVGQAMHRLLEWGDLSEASVQAVAQAFALGPQQADEARAMAQRILAGPGRWVFDPAQVLWAGNEVALQHEGRLLRLDRLVQARADGTWWVLDHKAAAEPQRQPELLAQLSQYRAAVRAAMPGQRVRAAFLTGQGELVEPDPDPAPDSRQSPGA